MKIDIRLIRNLSLAVVLGASLGTAVAQTSPGTATTETRVASDDNDFPWGLLGLLGLAGLIPRKTTQVRRDDTTTTTRPR